MLASVPIICCPRLSLIGMCTPPFTLAVSLCVILLVTQSQQLLTSCMRFPSEHQGQCIFEYYLTGILLCHIYLFVSFCHIDVLLSELFTCPGCTESVLGVELTEVKRSGWEESEWYFRQKGNGVYTCLVLYGLN